MQWVHKFVECPSINQPLFMYDVDPWSDMHVWICDVYKNGELE